MSDDVLLYTVDNLDWSISDVLAGITDGLNDMQAGHDGSSFEGGVVMLLRVPVEWAELVESAAFRNGVTLTPVGDEEGLDLC